MPASSSADGTVENHSGTRGGDGSGVGATRCTLGSTPPNGAPDPATNAGERAAVPVPPACGCPRAPAGVRSAPDTDMRLAAASLPSMSMPVAPAPCSSASA